MNWKLFVFFMALIALGCNSKKTKEPSIYEGTINVGIDESIRQLIDEQTGAYKIRYKGANFINFSIPENEAVKLLLQDSMDVICITRLLNDEEMNVLKERKITYLPAPMALDAVVLITNHNFANENVSLSDLKKLFSDENSTTKMVFDSGNSSNLNLLLEKLGIKDFNKKNVVSAGGTAKVFEWVKKDKNAIGFVGFNSISEKSSSHSRELRNSIKVLAVKDSADAVLPDKHTILEQTYPLHRTIYLHTLGSVWGVENGFIRFACTKPGQLIAEKMGLVPYYAIPKEFVLTNEPM